MESENSDLVEAPELEPVLDSPWPGRDEPGWVDVRCCGVMEDQACNKLLLRARAAPTVDGIRKVAKIELDMKCRRCKEINYRVVVV